MPLPGAFIAGAAAAALGTDREDGYPDNAWFWVFFAMALVAGCPAVARGAPVLQSLERRMFESMRLLAYTIVGAVLCDLVLLAFFGGHATAFATGLGNSSWDQFEGGLSGEALSSGERVALYLLGFLIAAGAFGGAAGLLVAAARALASHK